LTAAVLTQQQQQLSQVNVTEELISAVTHVAVSTMQLRSGLDQQATTQTQFALQLEELRKHNTAIQAQNTELQEQLRATQQQQIDTEYNQLQKQNFLKQKQKKIKKKGGRQRQCKRVPTVDAAAATTAAASATAAATPPATAATATAATASVAPAVEIDVTAIATPAACAAVLSAPPTATPACPSRFVATAPLCLLLALLFTSATASAVSQDSTVPLPSIQHWWDFCSGAHNMIQFRPADLWSSTLPCNTDCAGSNVFDDGG
jgi:TolA-binding protein